MFEETQFLESPTGARIAWHREPAVGKARGIVLISHGMSEHSKRYAEFARFLAARGYHVYAFDHRGHGETKAPDATQGQFARRDGSEKVIADVIAMREMAAGLHPNLPVILFGHSMGAIICLNTAISHPDRFAGFAVWNANLSAASAVPVMKLVLAIEAMFKGSDTPSTILPRMTFEAWGRKVPGHKTLFDWISSDEAEVAKYIADPLCGFDCTVSLWRDVADFIKRGADRQNLSRIPRTKPIQLVGGAHDPSTDNGKGVTWLGTRLAALGFSDVMGIIYPEARHETLNEPLRARAMEDFADWAAQIC